jgi:stearoyl-CoA desaturase (delta-9 desaturase)
MNAMNASPNPPAHRLNKINAIVLAGTPLASLGLGAVYIYFSGFKFLDLVPFFAMYFLTGLAITAGYHRHFAHRAYDCRNWVKAYFLLFGAAALQNSALYWVADHRRHHRNVDHEHDPYNIHKGFFWAHMGWIFFDEPAGYRQMDNIPDLKKSKLVQFQDRFYVPLAVIVGLGVPFLIGALFGRPWGGMLWGGLIRVVFVHHCTFLINSAAHYFGTRTYSEQTSARDSWWLAFFSYGEGYHNFHHTFPSDYRNGIAWYHWDPTKWLIKTLERVGAASKLRVTSEKTILATRASQVSGAKENAAVEAASDPFTHGAEEIVMQLKAGASALGAAARAGLN